MKNVNKISRSKDECDLELFSDLIASAPQYFNFYQEALAVPRVPFHATLSQSPSQFCPKSNYSVCHGRLHSLEPLEVFRKFSENETKENQINQQQNITKLST